MRRIFITEHAAARAVQRFGVATTAARAWIAWQWTHGTSLGMHAGSGGEIRVGPSRAVLVRRRGAIVTVLGGKMRFEA